MSFTFPQDGTSYVYDTHIPGSSLLVTCCNHGNEPLGVEVVKKLIEDEIFLGSLKKGKIGFLLLNPKAYEQQKRFIDKNMNRVRNGDGEGYEYTRKEEIKEFLHTNKFDYCIDLHTMSKPYGVIGICDKDHINLAKEIFDIEQIWVDKIEEQGTFVGYLKSQGAVGLGLEMGQHTDIKAVDSAVNNIVNFLKYLEIMEGALVKEKVFEGIYELTKELFCTTSEFTYSQQFQQLQKVGSGEIIGRDGEVEIKNDVDGEIYFGLATNTPIAGDGIGFLFRKIG